MIYSMRSRTARAAQHSETLSCKTKSGGGRGREKKSSLMANTDPSRNEDFANDPTTAMMWDSGCACRHLYTV